MEKRTLVLTSWYMPIQIVLWRDAITSLYLGKQEAIASYDEVVRSPSVEMRVPAVVRILRQTGARKRGIKFSKQNVASRDGFRCQYCLDRLPMSRLTFDHVMPRSRGGETRWENVVMACGPCNSRKDDRTPEEAGMLLHSVPRKPNTLPLEPLRLREADGIPEEWLAFAVG